MYSHFVSGLSRYCFNTANPRTRTRFADNTKESDDGRVRHV